jgi:hypothetical protein
MTNKKRNRRNWLILVLINTFGLLFVSDWFIGGVVALFFTAVSYMALTRMGVL